MTASVEPEGLVYQCKCGHTIAFPRDREIEETRCPECLAIIRPRDVLGTQAAADSKKPKRKEKEHAHATSQPVLISSDASGIVIQCKCGQRVTAPADTQDEHVRCPECFAMIRVADLLPPAAAKGKKDKKRSAAVPKASHTPTGPVLLGTNEKGMLIQCKCGGQVIAAHGQEDDQVRCPECLAIIKPSTLLDDLAHKKKDEASLAKKKYVYNPYADVDPVELLITAVKWCGLGALGVGAVGALGGAIYGSFVRQMAPSGPAMVWGFSGAILGILFFGTWGITRLANLPMERCVLVGVTIGTILAAIDWALETFIVSITDATALSCFVVGILGGIVTGLCVGLIQHPISEDDL